MMKKSRILFLPALVLALLVLTLVPGWAGSQVYNFAIGSAYGDQNEFTFEVGTTGLIRIRANWTGTANNLALILNGPGQTGYYQRSDGSSPLEVVQNVTPDILARGQYWTVRIVNFHGGSAAGQISVDYPEQQTGGVYDNFDRLAIVRVEKTNDHATITVDYALNAPHAQTVYMGAYILVNKAQSPYFGYVPVQLHNGSGQARVEVSYGYNNPPQTLTSDQIQVGIREGSGEYFCQTVQNLKLNWTR